MVQLYRAHCVIFTAIGSKSVPSTLVGLSFEPEIASQSSFVHKSKSWRQAWKGRCSAGNTFPLSLICALKFKYEKGMYLAAFTRVKNKLSGRIMVFTSHAKLSHFWYRVMRIYGTIFSSPEPSLITVPHCSKITVLKLLFYMDWPVIHIFFIGLMIRYPVTSSPGA